MKNLSQNIPADGLAGLQQNWKTDLMSGFMVSLLALPLSLGIAKASDFPNPMYGVLTAIIGGVLVSVLAGSRLTIKGPAAGLIVIVAGAIAEFGGGEHGWHLALGAMVVAAVFQILFGVLKFGKFSDLFPHSAVHGMLAAIGLIIISKQAHILLGINPVHPAGEPHAGKPLVEPFELMAALPHTFATLGERMPIVITGLVSLAIVLLLPMVKSPWVKKIPMPIVVLAVAIPLGQALGLQHIKGGLITFDKAFTDIVGFNADFSGIHITGVFIKYVILFAIIGSLESLLTAKAIDILDPFKRKSDFNKDLIAVGAGNVLSGVLGGLPMISEVARSSANVNNGAKTRWANFFHGVSLLVFMLFLLPVIQLIPNAALAALLIGVGIRLAHPKEFIHTLHIGAEQLLIFVITIVFTLGVDLLVGIGAGIATKFILEYINGLPLKYTFKANIQQEQQNDTYIVHINDAAVFSNFLTVKNTLRTIPSGKNVVIDLSNTKLVDHTCMESLHQLETEYHNTGGSFSIVGLDEHKALSAHPMAARKKAL